MVDELNLALSAASQFVKEVTERLDLLPAGDDPTLTAVLVRHGIAAVQNKEVEGLFQFVRRLRDDAERVGGSGHADA